MHIAAARSLRCQVDLWRQAREARAIIADFIGGQVELFQGGVALEHFCERCHANIPDAVG